MTAPTSARAVELFGRSGFTVYEGGRTMFDSPGLVFLGHTGDHWPDLDIFDHEGTRLGLIRLQVRRGFSRRAGPTSVLDSHGVEVLHIESLFRLGGRFTIAGVADADVNATGNRSHRADPRRIWSALIDADRQSAQGTVFLRPYACRRTTRQKWLIHA